MKLATKRKIAAAAKARWAAKRLAAKPIEELSCDDPVNSPAHYTQHKGVECIDVTENYNFCVGNAIKYLYRAGAKDNYVQDLKKAAWYIDREINRVSK